MRYQCINECISFGRRFYRTEIINDYDYNSLEYSKKRNFVPYTESYSDPVSDVIEDTLDIVTTGMTLLNMFDSDTTSSNDDYSSDDTNTSFGGFGGGDFGGSGGGGEWE